MGPCAPDRIQLLLDSLSYRRADQDVDFLERDEAHGLRLHLDYLKPELLLQEQGVQGTIVVFGSTRISEPATGAQDCRLVVMTGGGPGIMEAASPATRRLPLNPHLPSHIFSPARAGPGP